MITYIWGDTTLAHEITDGMSWRWTGRLAANLAMASLLCKAADVAYENRGDDEQRWRFDLHENDIGPYPERQP